jgi:hypothetical protein
MDETLNKINRFIVFEKCLDSTTKESDLVENFIINSVCYLKNIF